MTITRDEIRSILGPVDDDLVARILLQGATLDELREAWAWICEEDALINEGRPLPGLRMAALIDLLQPEDEDEPREPDDS